MRVITHSLAATALAVAAMFTGLGMAYAQNCGYSLHLEPAAPFPDPDGDGDECVTFCLTRVGTSASSVSTGATTVPAAGAQTYIDGELDGTIEPTTEPAMPPMKVSPSPSSTTWTEPGADPWRTWHYRKECWTFCYAEELTTGEAIKLTVSFPDPCGGNPPSNITTSHTYTQP